MVTGTLAPWSYHRVRAARPTQLRGSLPSRCERRLDNPSLSIGTGRVARARPDGYTINIGVMSTQVLNDALYSLQYDVLNDFAPIVPLVMSPFILFARKSLPGTNLNELIAWLKTKRNMASAGVDVASARLITEFFQKESGTQLTLVPYRGTAPAMQDLVAGQIDLFFSLPVQLPLLRAGSIKAYAVAGDARLALAPGIPTFGEMGLPLRRLGRFA